MSLFYFELRKLLFNKKTSLFAVYSVIGFTSTIFLIGSNDSYRAYEEMAVAYEGSFDNEKAAEAERIYNEVSARYGTDSRMITRSVKDQPEIILAVNYYAYAQQVEEYWNGTPPESAEEPYGIALLKSKLTELESQGKQDTFAYGELSDALQCLIELGEPAFANILLWENLFNNWGEHMMQFLLFVPLAFIIAPVFAVERSSGMDNLILSSRHGRKKIVTAKLLSVLAASTLASHCIWQLPFFSVFFLTKACMDGMLPFSLFLHTPDRCSHSRLGSLHLWEPHGSFSPARFTA